MEFTTRRRVYDESGSSGPCDVNGIVRLADIAPLASLNRALR